MRKIDIDEVLRNLLQLVDEAASGDPFVITEDGKPRVKVTPCGDGAVRATSRLGFLAGEIAVPASFDQMGAADIRAMFAVED